MADSMQNARVNLGSKGGRDHSHSK